MITSTTTLPMTVVCSGMMLITMQVTMAPTSLGQTTSVQHDVILLPQLILRDIMRGSAGLTTKPQQQQLQSKIPPKAYANLVMCTPQVSFSFIVEPSTNSLCHVLMSVMLFPFCFLVPMWLPCSQMCA